MSTILSSDFYSLEDEKKLEELQQKKLAAIGRAIHDLQKTVVSQNLIIEKQGNEVVQLKEGLTKQTEILVNQIEKTSYQQAKTSTDYIGLGPLGALHSPLIGAVYMGTLLKKIAIAKSSGVTTPRSEHTSGKNPLVINKVTDGGYMSWYYHHKRTWDLIKDRLNNIGYLAAFEACKTKDEIHRFINDMNC